MLLSFVVLGLVGALMYFLVLEHFQELLKYTKRKYDEVFTAGRKREREKNTIHSSGAKSNMVG